MDADLSTKARYVLEVRLGNEDPAVSGSDSRVKSCHAREVELLKEPQSR